MSAYVRMQARVRALCAFAVLALICATPVITLVAGSAAYNQGADPVAFFHSSPIGTCALYDGDGGPATASALCVPFGIAVRGNDTYFADAGNERVRKVDAAGIISTVVGSGAGAANGCNTQTSAERGDGGPAIPRAERIIGV